jgi:malonyl-ACP decarboxylase
VPPEVCVTGLGVVAPIGHGVAAFADALLAGRAAFGYLQREGRRGRGEFIGAELAEVQRPGSVAPQVWNKASLSAQAAIAVLHEAWAQARLDEVDPQRIGLIIGGSNFQQRELVRLHETYRERPDMLRPTYALTFMDTGVVGFCTAQFAIRGAACTVGGASASGQLAVVQAAQALQSGALDVCIAIGALMDLSHWECQALRSAGAMGSDRFGDEPARACRPFDRNHDGFIFGESSAAIVLETRACSERRGVRGLACLSGASTTIDGNRNPDPSVEGEAQAIGRAIHSAGWQPGSIDYLNPHGTGSPRGDPTELAALRRAGIDSCHINSTKSITGHGLCAAGAVEIVATLCQMEAGLLHPSLNLDDPIDAAFQWVRGQARPHRIRRALTLSMGFGGINTALCWEPAR